MEGYLNVFNPKWAKRRSDEQTNLKEKGKSKNIMSIGIFSGVDKNKIIALSGSKDTQTT